MKQAVEEMRVLEPGAGIFAFYDGRAESARPPAEPTWVDAGALSLGIASYALVAGTEAVVYDTHVSVGRARRIRGFLEARGVRSFTVVLSHWHLDQVAGTEAFADCEIIACERTAEILARDRPAIEAGTLEGPPPIDPLLLPTSVFHDRRELKLGATAIELIQTHIHSEDATLLWLPERRLLLCGDTLEDTVTYLDEPEHLDVHLANLERLRRLGAGRILPNHGHPEVIAAGGYPPELIDATEAYLRTLQRCPVDPALAAAPLRELVAASLASGALRYFDGYEAVHRHNVELVLDAAGHDR